MFILVFWASLAAFAAPDARAAGGGLMGGTSAGNVSAKSALGGTSADGGGVLSGDISADGGGALAGNVSAKSVSGGTSADGGGVLSGDISADGGGTSAGGSGGVVSSGDGVRVALPVVMYHSLSKTRSGDYTVTAAQFENDIRELIREGYTTVFGAELIAYLNGRGVLPSKPVMIVFDDGHYNNVAYGEAILKKYGAKAIINVVGKYADSTTDNIKGFYEPTSYLTWQHIRDIDRSVWEIGSHTYNMHSFRPRFGAGQKAGESEGAYRDALKADNDIMAGKLKSAGIETQIFAFPFGKVTETAKDFFAEAGYKIMFSCTEKVNIVPVPNAPMQYIMLHRFNRRGGYSNTTLMHKLQK
jgi:peptidoglycan/xylan/chitin deacetylase (PgdA/CDA1 family)